MLLLADPAVAGPPARLPAAGLPAAGLPANEDGGWLTVGDPGELPDLPCEPPCWAECGCCAGTVAPAGRLAAETGWAVPGVPVVRQPAGPAAVLVALERALDAVAALPASGSRVDTALLWALAERARGLALRELAELDRAGGQLLPGRQATPASWLREERLLTDTAARSAVHLARQLDELLPELGGLLRAGRVGVEHAAAVLAGVRGLDPEVVRESSAGLCALAEAADPVGIRSRLRELAVAVDDRLAAVLQARSEDRVGVHLQQVGDQTVLRGVLAGDGAARLRLAMDLAVEAARQAGDTRGRPTRQAEVLLGWADDALLRAHGPGDSTASDAHTVRTHLLVTCTPDQLAAAAGSNRPEQPEAFGLGQGWPGHGPDQAGGQAEWQAEWQAEGQGRLPRLLAADPTGHSPLARAAAGVAGDHDPLTRGALRRLACDATLSLVVLRPPGSPCPRCPAATGCEHADDPLYVGRSSRTVTGAQFRALVVRDRTCVVAGCHRPPARCAAHHVRHWADGGLTDLDNLVLLCHQHHHDHHDRGQELLHRDRRRLLTATGWAAAPPVTSAILELGPD